MVSDVVEQVCSCIDEGESFIIEAGAGSGKTWTLVQALHYVIQKKEIEYRKRNKKIACITYTNVAKEEIMSRINGNKMVEVKTIHDFLWGMIEPFQKELKREFIAYLETKLQKNKEVMETSSEKTQKYKNAKADSEKQIERIESLHNFHDKIQYKDNANYRKGIISHDVMLQLSIQILKKNSMIKKIVQDAYPIIFIDEYQDTKEVVAKVFLEDIKPHTSILFGLFGDYYQQIYNGSIGKIDHVQYEFKPIIKRENYRSSVEVISILNKLRKDNLEQEPSGDNKNGKCLFYYINDRQLDVELFIKEQLRSDLSISSSDELKKLFLVTKAIAKKNNYLELHELYDEEETIRYKIGQIKLGFIDKLRKEIREDQELSRLIFEMLPKDVQASIDNGSLRSTDEKFIKEFNTSIVKNKSFHKMELFKEVVKQFEGDIKIEIINRRLLETYFPGLFSKHGLADRRAKNKDMLLKNSTNRDCIFANFLFDIEELIELFQQNKIQLFLKKTSFELNNTQDKVILYDLMKQLIEIADIEKVSVIFDFVNKNRLLVYSKKLEEYIKNDLMKDSFFYDLMDLEYGQFRRLYYTVKETSPFSTNHGTKGAEFNNVVCFIDDNDWSSYSLDKYLEGMDIIGDVNTNNFDIQTRTRNLFYVICSRAKYNLAIVVLSELSKSSIREAKLLFGEENFISTYDQKKMVSLFP
ncbi:hypothetical protein C5G87_15405 [Paenibacillus peoriae]|uniref:UvrD-helicase domain-containing protein n=1 Tax=Paenibacillus peoriae TaxID=59893 RepID=UPI000CEBFF4D|nr:UvrD-helicase domain-containing protein [Paenibacillus peoriae]PPQ47515.1 hypothetical protein C5G87_15405 [Paenibacillus peoriae]